MNLQDVKEPILEFPFRWQEEVPLLVDEPSILIYPTFALSLGLNAAIVVDALDRLLQTSSDFLEGHKWVKLTYEQWQSDYFPFWSTKTIQRTMLTLENNGYIITTRKDTLKNRTKWYRLDYDKMDQLV